MEVRVSQWANAMTNDATIAVNQNALDWKLPSSRKVAIICLILTETGLFSIFVAGYVFYLGKSLTGPTPRDVLELPILSTICLLSSSITIVLAERAFNRDRTGLFKLFWFATIVLAGLFLTMTVAEWRTLIYQKGLTISTNLFGTTFYSLVGLHATHVIVGMCLLLLVLIFSLRGTTTPRGLPAWGPRFVTIMHRERLQMISWYWHFVDAVWIVVFTVVYVIGR